MRSLLIIVLILMMALFSCLRVTNVVEPNKLWILMFLRTQYIEEVGLLRAATRAYPDNVTIYVANDNVLAARALAVLGDRELSSRILTKLNNEHGGGFNGKVDILIGVDIPDEFYVMENELIAEIDGYRLVYERPGARILEDWYDYADLLVYRALDMLLWGSRLQAELLFLNLTKMWDGYGFRDKAYNATGVYNTYKCALFIYLYRALEALDSDIVRDYTYIKDKCHELIARAQDNLTGGIRTDYRVVDGRIVIEGDVNTETTSIVVLALYSNYPLMLANSVR